MEYSEMQPVRYIGFACLLFIGGQLCRTKAFIYLNKSYTKYTQDKKVKCKIKRKKSNSNHSTKLTENHHPQQTHLMTYNTSVAVLGWGQRGTGPPNLAQAPQILDWFRSALFLLEGFWGPEICLECVGGRGKPGPRWGSSRRFPRSPSRLGRGTPPPKNPTPLGASILALSAFSAHCSVPRF